MTARPGDGERTAAGARVGVLRHGVLPYGQALAFQHRLRDELVRGSAPGSGWVVCLQHQPVVTLGKRGKESDLVSPSLLKGRGVDVFRVDRGGEATYHGPGQLVVYPILRLDDVGLGVVDIVRNLAGALADTLLSGWGLRTEYDTEYPGLWTLEEPRRKIASVGMRVSRGVSTHGAAINLVNDLIPFSWIRACGMANAPMTRLQDYADAPVELEQFTQHFLERFAERVGLDLHEAEESLPEREAWVDSLPMPARDEDGAKA